MKTSCLERDGYGDAFRDWARPWGSNDYRRAGRARSRMSGAPCQRAPLAAGAIRSSSLLCERESAS